MSALKQKTAKEPSEELCEYNELVDIYGFSLPATGDECCKDFLQSLNLIHSRRAQTWTQQVGKGRNIKKHQGDVENRMKAREQEKVQKKGK